MRLYKITIRFESGAIWREWQTTCTFAAMEFVHSFGAIGFGLYSTPYSGPEIPNIERI